MQIKINGKLRLVSLDICEFLLFSAAKSRNLLVINNRMQLYSFCTSNHRNSFSNATNALAREASFSLPLSFAISIYVKSLLLSSLSQ